MNPDSWSGTVAINILMYIYNQYICKVYMGDVLMDRGIETPEL